MNSPIKPAEYPWPDDRPYYSYTSYLREKYGGRVQKVSIHAGFTCPNRDGSIARGGCTFCNNESFTPSYCQPGDGITAQLDKGLAFLEKRYRRTKKFVGYFQSYTNTYGSLETIKSYYDEALAHPKIDGLVISTRPDCINEEQLDYLEELAKSKIIILEFGIESCFNDTLDRVNRGHSFEDAERAIKMAAGRGFHVGGHLLFGLPGDNRERLLSQADIISSLPLDSIKFHQLQIVKGTVMAKQYRVTPEMFDLFDKEEYVEFVIDFLERLRPDICVQRFISEAPPAIKLAPNWGNVRTDIIIKEIEQRMNERGAWQGRLYQS
ncbi:TIGR01212 family radical SAM protein [Fulvitalea axinellae]|uniref:TIGR01212 family radical SAM protein n=1 Tax=Fulvitalea axinellae TaxID=1182444 RepID=A0AAU9CYX3_9BACT|nr:TIGR01212 family radical SAM protein [Fulvitalea axinellae]